VIAAEFLPVFVGVFAKLAREFLPVVIIGGPLVALLLSRVHEPETDNDNDNTDHGEQVAP
jgi:hypothetical protein